MKLTKIAKASLWCLAILSYLMLAVPFIMWAVSKDSSGLLQQGIAYAGFFVFTGYVTHINVSRYREEILGGTFLYIITFPQYVLPFVALGVVWLVFWFIDMVLWGLTNRHLLKEYLNWFKREILGIGKSNKKSGGQSDTFVINYGGGKRHLELWQQHAHTASAPYDYFDRYRDEYGKFWRTYDCGKTFREETQQEVDSPNEHIG